MNDELYTLLWDNEKGIYHLFGSLDHGNECELDEESICGHMEHTNSAQVEFFCVDDDEARRQCCKIGPKVCGVCVSHLFANPEK